MVHFPAGRRFLDLFVVAVDPRCNQRSPSVRLTSADGRRRLGSRLWPSERTGARQGVSECRVWIGALSRRGLGSCWSPLPDDRQDGLPGRLGQAGPCRHHGRQVGVNWGRIAADCTGFRTAWKGNPLISRGIRSMFDSPRGTRYFRTVSQGFATLSTSP